MNTRHKSIKSTKRYKIIFENGKEVIYQIYYSYTKKNKVEIDSLITVNYKNKLYKFKYKENPVFYIDDKDEINMKEGIKQVKVELKEQRLSFVCKY